jgi:hypothetical protein
MATFLCGLPVFEIIWKAGSRSTRLFTTGSYPAVVRCNHASTKYAEWKGAEPGSSQEAGYCSFRVQLVAARHTARQKWLRARLEMKRTGRASSLGAREPCEMRHDVGYGTGERRRGRNGDIPGRFHPASGRRLHSNSSLAETGLKTSLALARK